MTPSFLAIAFGSAMQAVASEKMDVSWDAKSRLKIKGHGEIVLEDFGVSVGATPEAGDFIRSNLVRAAGALLNSPWEPVIIERADMEIELRFAREILRLRGAELLEPEIDAGEPARIRLTFVPYAGQPITRVITVPIPRHLAGQTVSLEISPGYTENKEKADPESLGDLVRNLEDTTYPPKSILSRSVREVPQSPSRGTSCATFRRARWTRSGRLPARSHRRRFSPTNGSSYRSVST
jgi:hypothetical protein